MEEILHMCVDACTSAHRHGTVGKRSLPRIIVYRVCHGRFFLCVRPTPTPPHTQTALTAII